MKRCKRCKTTKRDSHRAAAAVTAIRAMLIDGDQWIEVRHPADAIEAITRIFDALGFGAREVL